MSRLCRQPPKMDGCVQGARLPLTSSYSSKKSHTRLTTSPSYSHSSIFRLPREAVLHYVRPHFETTVARHDWTSGLVVIHQAILTASKDRSVRLHFTRRVSYSCLSYTNALTPQDPNPLYPIPLTSLTFTVLRGASILPVHHQHPAGISYAPSTAPHLHALHRNRSPGRKSATPSSLCS